ncbi:MAG: NUDIX domain-containing protein [Flavobacteriales bacterium]|nr:NUDIX domain-containing protein [Flavobacteriales bacterium]
MSYPFNVRVYGVLVHEGSVLVTDELIRGMPVTKFPGGGLEYGEGTRDCLRRELLEELDVDAHITAHLYTTDVFQRSAFHNGQVQVLSVYYRFEVDAQSMRRLLNGGPLKGEEVIRWVRLDPSLEDELTLPLDRRVWRLLTHPTGE